MPKHQASRLQFIIVTPSQGEVEATRPQTLVGPKLGTKKMRTANRRMVTNACGPISWHMGVSINGGNPKSSISKGFSLINHPLVGVPPFMEPPPPPWNVDHTLAELRSFGSSLVPTWCLAGWRPPPAWPSCTPWTTPEHAWHQMWVPARPPSVDWATASSRRPGDQVGGCNVGGKRG